MSQKLIYDPVYIIYAIALYRAPRFQEESEVFTLSLSLSHSI